MDERTFISKIIDDKTFLTEALKSIPADVMAELEAKGREQGKSGQQDNRPLGETMLDYFIPASQGMGYSFDPATLASECETQMGEIKGFGKVKFLARFMGAASKASKVIKKK